MNSNMNKKTMVSIVMPCLNEAETLATCIRKAQNFLRDNRLSGGDHYRRSWKFRRLASDG